MPQNWGLPMPGSSWMDTGDQKGTDWSGIANAALPWVMGALSTGGDIYSNQQSRAEAERNRQFQERMSSTAVQRSVEDYRKAGLNPALAYDRSASSPGGTTANIGNPISSGISNATQLRQLQLAQRQADADIGLKRAQMQQALGAEDAARSQAELNFANTQLARQTHNFNTIVQPITKRLMETDAVMRALAIPEARNKAEWEELLGRGKPGLASAKTFAEILRMMFSK